jgi:LPS O-antigen subunit length determinant protein (WzzB/FepE family)
MKTVPWTTQTDFTQVKLCNNTVFPVILDKIQIQSKHLNKGVNMQVTKKQWTEKVQELNSALEAALSAAITGRELEMANLKELGAHYTKRHGIALLKEQGLL